MSKYLIFFIKYWELIKDLNRKHENLLDLKYQTNLLDKKIFTPIEFNEETQNHQKTLRSLREILLDQKNYGERLESYTMGPISESNPLQ